MVDIATVGWLTLPHAVYTSANLCTIERESLPTSLEETVWLFCDRYHIRYSVQNARCFDADAVNGTHAACTVGREIKRFNEMHPPSSPEDGA